MVDDASAPMRHPGIEPAEQAAALLASSGMPRMQSRVLMALVGSPDDGYTAADLADRLGVSAAAVSGAVRNLQAMRLIQRLSRPGDRRDRYDLSDDVWSGVITANVPLYAQLGALMHRIADENTDAPVSTARAHESAAFLSFLAERMPQLVAEWDARADGDAQDPDASVVPS
ncbi:MarR family transcriptional regulator [Microbacterium awajiense]|uniref:MarR family transcriptional regulator n=1 Tax=Microbacterium awajiense TaxID=415214 RepID=A0ABP7ASZ3_9MICO